MNEFWAMGGYGVYVWPSYALTAFVLLVNVWLARRAAAAAREAARRRLEIAGGTE